jgi:4a-hydroxytetrahydrobiopterin dehydratase
MERLTSQKCAPCEGGVQPLTRDKAAELLEQLPFWKLDEKAAEITRTFIFKDFYETMAFVNAVAWIANQEGHHPDMEVGYSRCVVRYSTHAISGLSRNDFICAAKVNALIGVGEETG